MKFGKINFVEEGAWDTVRKEVCTSMNFHEGKSGGKKSGFMLDWYVVQKKGWRI